MFPSDTSLIPVTVALTQFLSDNGLSAFFQNYPYWYLGSTPFKYLIGPVVPIIGIMINSLIPALDFFQITFGILALALLLSIIGWVTLIGRLNKATDPTITSKTAVIFMVIYAIMPWKYLNSFAMEEASNVVAKAMMPFVLVVILRYFELRNRVWFTASILAIAFLLLISTNIITTLIVGIGGLCLTASLKLNPETGKIRFRFLTRKIKRSLWVLFIGIVLSTIWYGPGFWVAILVNPGIGGATGAGAILKLLEFSRNIVPLIMVAMVIKLTNKIKDKLTLFTFVWLGSFGVLSLYRFLANPYFWMDWASWFYEVEVGLALLFTVTINSTKRAYGVFGVLIVLLITGMVYSRLGAPVLISNKSPESLATSVLKELPENSKVYLTGSSVFWLNTESQIVQVRGGRDEVSLLPGWQKDSYIIRESSSPTEIKKALGRLGISYVVVNTKASKDYYKDYKNLGIWESVGTTMASVNGDLLIKVATN